MKYIVCIENKGFEYCLTRGKIYEVAFVGKTQIDILDDDGDYISLFDGEYITVEQHRQEQIDKIINGDVGEL